MARSPLLGGERAPQRPRGTGTDLLGPSDTSDSGSDVQGADAGVGDAGLDSDSDSGGTGERAQAGRDTLRREAPDIGPDHIEGSDAAMVADDVEGLAADEDDPDAPEDDVDVTSERDRAIDA